MERRDLEIMHYLNVLKEQSKCLDKQVAAVIVNRHGEMVAEGVNTIIACDKNCHDKENRICEVIHAEVVACANLDKLEPGPFTMYVNLFPCVPCQQTAERYGVEEIVVFGPQHKDQVFSNIRLEPNLYAELLNHNGPNKQLSVAQGELAELITAISDFFHRPDKEMTIVQFMDEVVDVELMLEQIKLIAWNRDPEAYNWLREIRTYKYGRLLDFINKGNLHGTDEA
jgi:deoxycytidylate deaminase